MWLVAVGGLLCRDLRTPFRNPHPPPFALPFFLTEVTIILAVEAVRQ